MGYIRPIRFPLLLLLLTFGPAASSARVPASTDGVPGGEADGEAYALVTLTCAVLDGATMDTTAARCLVIDGSGNIRYPPLGESFYHHLHGNGYFYTDGVFSVTVATGIASVRVSRGPEYDDYAHYLTVAGDTTVSVVIPRIVDMAGLGWYGGDTHVHINHSGGYYILEPVDAHLMARAEGLSVVTCLDNEYYFTGHIDPSSTERCIVYMSQERRTTVYGDIALLGLSELLYPLSTEWTPLVAEIADSAHAQPNTCVVVAHPVTTDDFWDIDGWPGAGLARGLPVDVFRGTIDCMEVMSYSNCHGGGIELDLWYRFLNCGFAVSCCAGTDACMNRLDTNPLGGFRTYASIGDDSLTYDRWVDAVKDGRSFITNGPLFTRFTVAGRTPGCRVFVGRGCVELPCSLSLVCDSGLERAEIVRNGEVTHTFPIGGAGSGIDTTFVVPIDGSAWIAARVYGTNEDWLPVRDWLFAHTNPIYITMEDERIIRPGGTSYFVNWIADLESLARSEGYWPSARDSMRAFDEFAAARRFYEILSDVTTAAGGYDGLPDPALYIVRNAPNPFTGGTTISFGSPFAGSDARTTSRVSTADISIYDAGGRVVRRLFHRAIPAGMRSIYWDGTDEGGRRVASGVYFCRLRVGRRSRCAKMILVR